VQSDYLESNIFNNLNACAELFKEVQHNSKINLCECEGTIETSCQWLGTCNDNIASTCHVEELIFIRLGVILPIFKNMIGIQCLSTKIKITWLHLRSFAKS